MERALREECGWKLGIPYWDYTIDTATDVPIAEWPIFNATYGFGGNGPWVETPTDPPPMVDVPGRTGGGCVQDGPFTYDKFVLGIGPGFNPNISNPHCLLRDFAPGMGYFHLTKAVWNDVLSQPDFGRFAKTLETSKHLIVLPSPLHQTDVNRTNRRPSPHRRARHARRRPLCYGRVVGYYG